MSKLDEVKQLVIKWDQTSDDRIDWDTYFMAEAIISSSRSPCHRLHVGCVLVRDKRVISMGYNGFLPGEEHKSVVRRDCDGKDHEQATVHAEQNAICFAAKNGITLDGAVAYINYYPCLNCAKLLVSSGIKKVYFHENYSNDPLVSEICTKLEIIQLT
jgi:dCMP deaminase